MAYDGAQILDVAGPAEVFARCAAIVGESDRSGPIYQVRLVSGGRGRSIRTSAGLAMYADTHIRVLRDPIDTLIVAGGAQCEAMGRDRTLAAWLRIQAPRVRRLCSVCTGAFALAGAGLLDGRRAATHWAWSARLAAAYPRVRVDADPIYIHDGGVYTSAGITAAVDLALHLVEEDYGSAIALRIARELVLFLRRPGSQAQFATPSLATSSEREPVRESQQWIAANLAADVRIEQVASIAGMSVRHFSRVFRREVGLTPGRYIERLRVEAACLHLSETSHRLKRVARECGFHSEDVLRRAFMRLVRVNPLAYRARFSLRRAATRAVARDA